MIKTGPVNRKRNQPWYSSKEEDTKEEESGEDTEVMEDDSGEVDDQLFIGVLRDLVGELKTLNGILSTKFGTVTSQLQRP